jgi:nicotinic acid mononucleotide adenylyltransferase
MLNTQSHKQGTMVESKKIDEFIFCPTDMRELSSTLIRERLKLGQNIDDLTHPKVVAYLKEIQRREIEK